MASTLGSIPSASPAALFGALRSRHDDTREVTVAVLTDGSYKSAICRGEQIRTLRKGKRLIPVLGSQGADVPIYIEALQYRDSTKTDYAACLAKLLGDIRAGATATLPDAYRKTRVTYLTAPPQVAVEMLIVGTIHLSHTAGADLLQQTIKAQPP